MIRRLYPAGTFSGDYHSKGDLTNADCIVVHTFGSGPGGMAGQTNEALMQYAVDLRQQLGDLALIATRETAQAMPEHPTHILDGDLANWVGQGTGTWGELLQARDIMIAENLSRPILVAHSYHIGRVANQAVKLSIDPIIPEGLPSVFDPKSTQTWTRNSFQWAVRTAPGNIVLALQGRL